MRIAILLLTFFINHFVSSQFSNSLHFDGVNDYVNLNAIVPTLENQNDFTIEFWINANSNQPNAYAVLFAVNTIVGNLEKTDILTTLKRSILTSHFHLPKRTI